MILEKAYYQQNFSVGQFLFTTYGLGALIEENETHQEVYAQLKERVYAQFRADNPHLEESNVRTVDDEFTARLMKMPNLMEPDGLEQPTTAVKQEPTKAQTVEEQIRTCQDADTLSKTYKYLVRTNKSWQNAYEETMDRLTQKTTIK